MRHQRGERRRRLPTLERCVDFAKHQLRRDGELRPVAFVEGKDEVVTCILEPGQHRADLFYRLGSTLGYGIDAWRVVFVVDGYVGKQQPGETDEDLPAGGLADDPLSEDCLLAAELRENGKNRSIICPYEKAPLLSGPRFRFGKLLKAGDGMAITFSNFFAGKSETELMLEDLATAKSFEQNQQGEDRRTISRRAARREAVEMWEWMPV
jgi:hypothetical protein